MRGLEARLGVRLLTRTTRRVAATEAGERLVQTLGPRFDEIETELAALSELRDKPAGTVRITATEYAPDAILLPRLTKLLHDYPDIKVEIAVDYGLTDIVSQRYDAGVRSGEQVGKDMIALRIGPELRMAVVGAPAYFRKRSEPVLVAPLSPVPPQQGARPPLRMAIRRPLTTARLIRKAIRTTAMIGSRAAIDGLVATTRAGMMIKLRMQRREHSAERDADSGTLVELLGDALDALGGGRQRRRDLRL
jgi:DNA-binding transcriptional LysR family regulator